MKAEGTDDRATYELMRVFYKQLFEQGPAGALRQARQTLMTEFEHPYFWAPFVVTGDSGPTAVRTTRPRGPDRSPPLGPRPDSLTVRRDAVRVTGLVPARENTASF
jgi:hypothetical protein